MAASTATTRSAEAGRASATNVSGAAPSSASRCASRLALASSSAYVRVVAPCCTAGASGVRAACRANRAGRASGVAVGAARSASAASCARSSAESRSSALSRRSGSWAAASRSRTNRSARSCAVSGSNSARAYSRMPRRPPGAPSSPLVSATLNDRSQRAVPVASPSKPTARPGMRMLGSALFWKASITWNSGCAAADRTGLTASTSRSKGRSWWS